MKIKAFSVISTFLAVACVFALLSPSAHALTYRGSSSYKSGPYYKNLCEVNLTGDRRLDIVNIAKSQIGYFEGSNSSQLSGTVNGEKNFTEYGRWYGMQDMWCAIFVSWCAYVANVPTSVIPKHAFTPDGLKWFQNKGLAYSRAQVASGKYTPQPGDIIYFKSSRNNNPTNHVGIVTDYKNKTVYTVEGNSSLVGIDTNGGAVANKTHSISDTYIVYICKPDYESLPDNVNLRAADINDDGYVNNKDIVALFRYVSEGKKNDEARHDYNGDGEANNKDVTALFRFISSYKG